MWPSLLSAMLGHAFSHSDCEWQNDGWVSDISQMSFYYIWFWTPFPDLPGAWLISDSSPFKTVAEEEIVSVCWRYVQIFLAKIRKNNAGMRRTRLGKNYEFFRKLWLVK